MMELTDKAGNNIFKTLIKIAEAKHNKISVISGKNSYAASMTKEPNKIILWFDYYLECGHKTSGAALYNEITGEYKV